jgi:hypothetical protein
MNAAKFCLSLTAAVLTSTALAEDPTTPRLRPTPPAPPAPVEEPKEPVLPDTLGLIPETPEPAKKPKGGALKEKEPGEKVDRTTAAENELGSRIRLRELTNRVRQEPKIAAELERANAAKTDYEKREALKSYYKQLYDRIVKIDPSLDKRVAEIRAKSLHRLAETRVDPTEPIDPADRTNGRE